MIAVVDADSIAIACAASCEDHTEPYLACERAIIMANNILRDVGATEYEFHLTGKNNFRYAVYPEYKATRIGGYRPKWEKAVKEFLVTEFNATYSEGCEADDIVGIRLTELKDKAIACHIDKDIDMIPGNHYTWPITRLGKTIRESKQYVVSDDEALANFYYQLIVGDTTDNIKGAVGSGPKAAAKVLSLDKKEWYEATLALYSCEEELELNAKVLWIWRKPNDNVMDWIKG